MDDASPVIVSVEGSTCVIELNRPDRLNAMTKEMAYALTEALERVEHNRDMRTVIVTGRGRGFCAGGDLPTIAAAATVADGKSEERDLLVMHQSVLAMRRMPQPIIAAVNGACVGAGLSWACAADIRIASRSAVFRTGFLAAGLPGDFGGTWTLPRIVGAGRARELYLMNRKVGADEALAMGLVSGIYDQSELRSKAIEMAKHLSSAPSAVLAGMKSNLNGAEAESIAEALDREAATTAYVIDSTG